MKLLAFITASCLLFQSQLQTAAQGTDPGEQAVVASHATDQPENTVDSVKAVINQLFDGMKNVDPRLILASFADSAYLQTIARSQDGKTIVRNESVSGFANSISKQAKGALDEQIQFEVIKIDGDLASVWTPYKFYFSGKFSHCGVNSFQLVRLNGNWKIQYLIDTRRRTGCE